MVSAKRLELPTSCESSRRSSQLSYALDFFEIGWWREVELNYRHKDFQSFALPLSYRAVVDECFVFY